MDLDQALGLEVDLLTYDSLNPKIREAILREQVDLSLTWRTIERDLPELERNIIRILE